MQITGRPQDLHLEYRRKPDGVRHVLYVEREPRAPHQGQGVTVACITFGRTLRDVPRGTEGRFTLRKGTAFFRRAFITSPDADA